MVRLVPGLTKSDKGASALLIECRGRDEAALQESIDEVTAALKKVQLSRPPLEIVDAHAMMLTRVAVFDAVGQRVWGLCSSAHAL